MNTAGPQTLRETDHQVKSHIQACKVEKETLPARNEVKEGVCTGMGCMIPNAAMQRWRKDEIYTKDTVRKPSFLAPCLHNGTEHSRDLRLLLDTPRT